MPAIDLGSHTIWYDAHGHGRPLVLIPGLGASRLAWQKQVVPLAERFHLVILDNRDAGDSSHATAPYGISDMAEDAARVIEALKLGQTDVMGWSMGGAIAQELAYRRPALVERLALVATTPGGKNTVPAAPEIGKLLSRTETESVESRVRRTYPHLAAPGYMNGHPDDLEMIIRSQEAKAMPLTCYRRQLAAMVGWTGLGEHLADLRMPTLVIHGDLDPLLPYANGQYLAAHIPGATLHTYHGVGHLPPIEATARFNRDVATFFA